MGKDFEQSLGKHSRRKPVGKTVASPDVEKLKKENVRLNRNILELQDSLRALTEKKNGEIEKMGKEIAELENKLSKKSKEPSPSLILNDDDFMIVMKNKELQGVGTIKTFNAVKNEIESQGQPEVKLLRRTLENQYGVNPNQVTTAINALVEHGFIEVIYKSERKRTFKVIKNLPIIA
jgi:hypothetical protein